MRPTRARSRSMAAVSENEFSMSVPAVRSTSRSPFAMSRAIDGMWLGTQGPAGRREIREVVARRERAMAWAQASARQTELSGEGGQRGDGPPRLPPVSVLVHAGATHDDHGRSLRRVCARQAAYGLH